MITKYSFTFLSVLFASHLAGSVGLRCYECSDNHPGNCQATDVNKENGYIRDVECAPNGSCAVVWSYTGKKMVVKRLACLRPCNETSSCDGDSPCVTCCGSDYCNVGDEQSGEGGETGGAFSCRKGLFKCHSQEICLEQLAICDGSYDCEDHSDETNCPTPMTETASSKPTTKAITDPAGDYVCPSRTMFLCKSESVCINEASLCDGQSDCSDGSDEMNCGSNCTKDDFKCSGVCVPAWRVRCNRITNQCKGDEDELGCSAPCASDLFQCGNAMCILGSYRCDGNLQCGDYSDETNCTSNCSSGEFLCNNGHCVDKAVVCDGGNNCWDWSDEKNCDPCSNDSFRCWDYIHGDNCYLDSERCDGQFHCKKHADEKGCGVCTPDQFACNVTRTDGSHCYDASQLCDRRIDCDENYADECNANCQHFCRKCPHDETILYPCLLDDKDGTCYNASQRCDGIADCRPSASDEMRCSHKCDHFCKDTFQCWDESKKCDHEFFCPDFSDEEGCEFCLPNEFRCPVGLQCFSRSEMCDGFADCVDGFDEKHCNKVKYHCGNQEYDEAEKCNGRVFCQSGEDEKGCASCRPDQFTCGGNKLSTLCYDQSQRCDGRADCPSPSVDELYCDFKGGPPGNSPNHGRAGPTVNIPPTEHFSSKAIIATVSVLLVVTLSSILIIGYFHKRRATRRSAASRNDRQLLPPPYSETDTASVYFNNRPQIQDCLAIIDLPPNELDDDLPSYEESLLLAHTNVTTEGSQDECEANEGEHEFIVPNELEANDTNEEQGNPVDTLL